MAKRCFEFNANINMLHAHNDNADLEMFSRYSVKILVKVRQSWWECHSFCRYLVANITLGKLNFSPDDSTRQNAMGFKFIKVYIYLSLLPTNVNVLVAVEGKSGDSQAI